MKDRRITRTKKAIQKAYLDMLKKKGTEKMLVFCSNEPIKTS